MLASGLHIAKFASGNPIVTFDMNVLRVRPIEQLKEHYAGLPELEFNAFMTGQINACVTPESFIEIIRGSSLPLVGTRAYDRLRKSHWFNSMPLSGRLDLTAEQASGYWLDIRKAIFPTVIDSELTFNQQSDITQLFYCLATSGNIEGAAFITQDKNFLNRAADIERDFHIKVCTPMQAWSNFQPKYGLTVPSPADLAEFDRRHSGYLNQLILSSGG